MLVDRQVQEIIDTRNTTTIINNLLTNNHNEVDVVLAKILLEVPDSPNEISASY